MTKAELQEILLNLLPGEFDRILMILEAPVGMLSSAQASQSTRAREVIDWCDARNLRKTLKEALHALGIPHLDRASSAAEVPRRRDGVSDDESTLPTEGTAAGENPFLAVGTLPLAHKTYVTRNCDGQLRDAIKEQSLIAIEGGYSSGKSSLALRLSDELKAHHHTCYFDLQEARTDTEHAFASEFFNRVSECVGRKIDTWTAIDTQRARPLTIILDEFGLLAAAANSFVPRLCHRAVSRKEHFKVVVCVPVHPPVLSIQHLLTEFGIANERYHRGWHRISVTALDPAGVEHLIALLPTRSRAFAKADLDTIARHSNSAPASVQSLCSNLFDAEAAGASDDALKHVIASQDSYKP